MIHFKLTHADSVAVENSPTQWRSAAREFVDLPGVLAGLLDYGRIRVESNVLVLVSSRYASVD